APALLALAGPQRKTAALWLALVAAYGAWVVAIGGDVFAFHRFLVPVVPLLAVLAALGADALLGAWPRAATALLLLAAALWAASLRGTYAYAWSAAQGVDAITATLRPLGLALGERAPPGTTVAMLSIGALRRRLLGPGCHRDRALRPRLPGRAAARVPVRAARADRPRASRRARPLRGGLRARDRLAEDRADQRLSPARLAAVTAHATAS